MAFIEKQYRLLYLALLIDFVLFGMSFTIIGAILPSLIKDLGWPRIYRCWFSGDKGYRKELDMFFAAVRDNTQLTRWVTRQLDASLATIEAAAQINPGQPRGDNAFPN